MKSIISNTRECIVCYSKVEIHKHHIYHGEGQRKISEREGCWCYLCATHHNSSKYGVHFDRDLDLKLKRECQEAWEHIRGSREEFIETFGRSYI